MKLYLEINKLKSHLESMLQSSEMQEVSPDDIKELKHYLISALFLIRLSRNLIIKDQCNQEIEELNDHA